MVTHGVKLRKIRSHKQYSYKHTFGAPTTPRPLELDMTPEWAGAIDQNADGYPEGCTGYAQSFTASVEDGTRYKPAFTYEKTLLIEGLELGQPVQLDDSLKSTRVYGLQATDETTDEQALLHRRGQMFEPEPSFEGICDAIWNEHEKGAKRPVSIASLYYPEWNIGEGNGIIPPTDMSYQASVGHNYSFTGWKLFNGKPYIIAVTWQGAKYGDKGKSYYPKEVIDQLMKVRGTQATIVAKARPEDIKTIKISIIETLLSYLKMLVAKLMVNQPEPQPTPVPAPVPHVSRIPEWAEAIKLAEGWFSSSRSTINNNPGNIKFTELARELGATHGDDKNFAVFPTYAIGFNALCDFLELACKDELKDYHHARTLRQFTNVYAQPPNDNYCLGVAGRLEVLPDINIKELL